ncbi:UNVERIFIED_CONTAM: hypothetical protein K2H54_074946 [Gekko kuhli]
MPPPVPFPQPEIISGSHYVPRWDKLLWFGINFIWFGPKYGSELAPPKSQASTLETTVQHWPSGINHIEGKIQGPDRFPHQQDEEEMLAACVFAGGRCTPVGFTSFLTLDLSIM